MNNLCIIPARGGSKRIPRKNIKDFLGKPIIAYSIEVAIKSNLFSEIIVSTDDEEIASIARKYGAKVPFYRSPKSSNDFAILSDVINEVMNQNTISDIKFDFICCLLSTAPFVKKSLLSKGLELINKKDFDSIRPIVKFNYPIERALEFNNDVVTFKYPENKDVRSQDLSPSYHDAGMFYWFNPKMLMNGDKKGAFIIDSDFAHDIDTIDDWYIAEKKYKFLINEKI